MCMTLWDGVVHVVMGAVLQDGKHKQVTMDKQHTCDHHRTHALSAVHSHLDADLTRTHQLKLCAICRCVTAAKTCTGGMRQQSPGCRMTSTQQSSLPGQPTWASVPTTRSSWGLWRRQAPQLCSLDASSDSTASGWDMCHSKHFAALLHAIARAMSGAPVYVSDKPDQHASCPFLSPLLASPRGKLNISYGLMVRRVHFCSQTWTCSTANMRLRCCMPTAQAISGGAVYVSDKSDQHVLCPLSVHGMHYLW